MLMLRALPHQKATFAEAIVDTVLLVVLSTPAVYVWVIKPFVRARDEALAQVNRLALTDPLTQLANRRLISRYLTGLAASSVTNRDHGAVLLMDLDGFKPVNDLHGHETGDAVLVEVAERLRSLIRSGDVVGRLGGDEFVVLVQRLGADVRIAHDAAVRMAEKLRAAIKAPIRVNGKTIYVSASIGIRLLGFEELDAETALGEADLAMYRAKEAGRDRAVVFERRAEPGARSQSLGFTDVSASRQR